MVIHENREEARTWDECIERVGRVVNHRVTAVIIGETPSAA